MNYEGAHGLEFGEGNNAIDPAVAIGAFTSLNGSLLTRRQSSRMDA
jgi:hypothetical protein